MYAVTLATMQVAIPNLTVVLMEFCRTETANFGLETQA